MENLRVLLCDDSDEVRANLVNLLIKCNITKIFQISDGCEVVEFLVNKFNEDETKIDLLITDYIMPKMDGLSVVKEIREFNSKDKKLENYLRNLPIIVATAQGEINSMLSFVEAGVNSYIIKPCNKITLIEKIGVALGKDKPG